MACGKRVPFWARRGGGSDCLLPMVLLLLVLSGCVAQPESEDVLLEGTDISDESILIDMTMKVNQVAINHQESRSLGEFVRDGDGVIITVEIKNPSSRSYQNVTMSIVDELVRNYKFMPDSEGNVAYPGEGGTCTQTLDSGASCSIKLFFESSKSEVARQKFKINYSNLIGPREREFELSYLSGTPAKLIFDGESGTQFPLGEKVGVAEKPVIERTVETDYGKTLTVKNSGELTARNLIFSGVESCQSTLSGSCPAGYGDVYTFTHNCPTSLGPGAECQLVANLRPKNQDPLIGPVPDEIREILYSGIYTIDYEKDPLQNISSLAGYFSTYSTQIQANFNVTIDRLDFSEVLTVGNRERQAFRLVNVGYRAGKLKSLNILDTTDALLGKCVRPNASSKLLYCYDTTVTTVRSLEDLSFFMEDTSDCMPAYGEEDVEVAVDGVCLFNLVFQPSVAYLTDQTFDIKVEAEFDSQWKNEVNIVNTFLFESHAESVSAAQIKIRSLTFDGDPVTDYTDDGDLRLFDLGRLALISPNFPYYRTIVLSVENIGTTDATSTIIRDGQDTVIPFSDDNPAGVELGRHDPKYFRSTLANDGQCKVIGGICSIITSFSPMGMPSPSQNDENMFDYIGSPTNYKSFFVEYEDGSLYSDNNRDTNIKDIAKKAFETRVTTTLIMKGLLQQLAISNVGRDFNPNIIVMGQSSEATFILRNIGTGPIDYIGDIADPPTSMLTRIPTTNLAIHGAVHDCLDIVDFSYSPGDDYATIMGRSASWASLGVEEVCALTFHSQLTNLHRGPNSISDVTIEDSFLDFVRWFNLEDLNTNSDRLWEYNTDDYVNSEMRFRWFDGDESDPSLASLPASNPQKTFGRSQNSNNFSENHAQVFPAKVVPVGVRPYTSAVAYRQGYARSQLDYMASMVQAADSIDPLYIFGPGNSTVQDEVTHTAFFSSTHAATSVSNSYDYSIHFGSFPTGRSHSISFDLFNAGFYFATLTNLSWDFLDSSFAVVDPLTLGTLTSINSIPVNLSFETTTAGTYQSILNVSYNNGLNTKNIKIQLIVDAVNSSTIPTITGTVANFSLSLSDTNPPIETLDTATGVTLTDNHAASAGVVEFEYIKNNNITPNDGYDKKRFTFTNNTPYTMNNVNIYFLGGLNTLAPVNLTASGYISILANDCTANMTLAASGGSCSIDIKFQPDENASDETFYIGALYEVQANQYLMRHFRVDFLAREPSRITPVGLVFRNINIEGSQVLPNTYHLDPGPTIYYDQYPYPLMFHFQVTNSSALTKASLLKTYHDWLVAEGVGGVTSTTRPSEPGDYDLTFGPHDYAIIHKSYYLNNDDRFTVRATKGCLVGDDDEVEDFRNGFLSGSTAPCYLHVTLNLDMSYLARSLDFANEFDMAGNYLRLPYYSNLRSSIDFMNLYFAGTIKPDLSFKDQGYFNVEADSTGTIRFDWNDMTENDASVGSITGYRVFLSENLPDLNSSLIFNGTSNYYDTVTSDIEISDTLNNGQRYHLTVYPIRSSGNYNGAPSGITVTSFEGLASGEYLSESNIGAVSVVIPPFGYSYLHDEKALMSSQPEDYNPKTYAQAQSACSSLPPTPIVDGVSSYISPYKLLNSSMWSVIEADTSFELSGYTNGLSPLDTPHWLDEGSFNIDSMLSGVTGYNSAASSQDLSPEGYYYIRDSSCFACDVPMARGGLYGATATNLTSFFDPELALPVARCYVDLSGLP